AARFEVPEEIISSTVDADNLLMAIYFLVLISIPTNSNFRNKFGTPYIHELEKNADNDRQADSYRKRKAITVSDIALAVGTSFAIVAVSFTLAEFFTNLIPDDANIFLSILRGIIGDNYLMLTTLTLILVTMLPKYFESINGAQEIGTFLIYIF